MKKRVIIFISLAICLAIAGWGLWLVLQGDGRSDGPSGDVMATVNGFPVTRSEFDMELKSVEGQLFKSGNPVQPDRLPELRKQVLERLINLELLYREGVKDGLGADEEVLRQEKEKLRKRFPDEATYRRMMGQINITEEQLDSRYRKGMTIQRYAEKHFADKVKVTEKETRDFFERNRQRFSAAGNPSASKSYNEVKGEIENALRQEKIDGELGRFVERLRKEAKVEILVQEAITPGPRKE